MTVRWPLLAGLPLAIAMAACASDGAREGAATVAHRRVRAADGVELHVVEAGRGEPTLLLIHGWCCDAEFWRGQIAELGRTHHVVAVDLGGHGKSGARRDRWDLDTLARDLVAVADAVGSQELVLVGHSMGGAVALAATPLLSGRVRAVVGVESLHDFSLSLPREVVEEAARGFERDFDGSMRTAVRGLLPSGADPRLLGWIVAHATRTDHRAAVALLRSVPHVDLAALASEAGVPIRCLNSAPWGTGGVPTDRSGNRQHADFDATILDGTGHYPMLESPAVFNDYLRGLLDGLPPLRAGPAP